MPLQQPPYDIDQDPKQPMEGAPPHLQMMHHQQQFTMPNPQMQKHSFIGGAGQGGLQMRWFLLSEDQKRVEETSASGGRLGQLHR